MGVSKSMAANQRLSIRLDDIAKAIKAEVVGDSSTVMVSGISSLEDAGQEDLAFVSSDRFVGAALRSEAAAFVVERPIASLHRVQLVVPNPAYASALIIDWFFTPPFRARGIAQWVVQGENVQIGPDVSIYPFVTLGDRVSIGARVTLRGARMYEFLDRLVSIALPRIRDFRGLSPRSFDGRGNYSLGIREQIIFPEINYDDVDAIRGLDVSITTTARTDEEALALLRELGLPFRPE